MHKYGMNNGYAEEVQEWTFQRGERMMSTATLTVSTSLIRNLSIGRVVQAVSDRRAQGRALREALEWAYTVSARQYYPRWATYLLDPEFQALGANHLRDCYLKGVACLTPVELANFWADRIRWLDEETKQRHIAELVQVASRFLRSLEAELCAAGESQAGSVA
jgi:hypothetical protein